MAQLHHKIGDYTAVEALHETLDDLEHRYGDFLKQESMQEEVNILKHKVEESINGSPEAVEYLNEHGGEMLRDLQQKLSNAVAEQTRLIDESPAVASRSTSRTTDRASKASAEANEAADLLSPAIHELQE